MPIQKFTVSRDESIYEAWPDLVQTDGGKLICIFTECEHHGDRNNSRIAICESTDRGRTWSKKKYLTEKGTRESHFNNARISKTKDGRLAVICDKIDKDENHNAQLYLWYADSEGEKWTEPVILPFVGIVPEKVRVLDSGRMIVSAQFMNKETEKLEQYLWYSDDDGATWSERVTVAADKRYNLCEASILDCKNDTLVCFLRENSRIGCDVLKVISYDNGEHWSEIYTTQMDCGHRPVCGFLNDGRVMVTYRYIPGKTQNTFAAFFEREALFEKSRQKQHTIIMPLDYDRNVNADGGYTGWTQFDDGEIYVVNYIRDDADKAYIRGYSFCPEDVQLPPSKNNSKGIF